MWNLLFPTLCYLFGKCPNSTPDQPYLEYRAVFERNIYPLYNVSDEEVGLLPSTVTGEKQPFGGQKSDLTAITPKIRPTEFFVFLFAVFLMLNTLIMVIYIRRLKHQVYAINQKFEEFASLLQNSQKPAVLQKEGSKIPTHGLIQPGKNQSETRVESSLTLYKQIIGLIEEEKLFLDPNLDQQLICKKLATNKTYVYETIHRHSALNFKGLINHFRVKEAQRIIQQLILEKKDLNYEMIIQLSGFNSKTSFYRIFKAQVGLSPKEFEDEIRAQRSL